MKAETLKQPYNSEIDITCEDMVIWIDQGKSEIVIDRESLPDLIKILQSFVVMLLLSVSVFGQSAPKGATTAELIPHIGHYLSQSNDVLWDSGKSDTVAVYMLVTKKVTHDYPLELRQIKGYSVTPRIAYNSLPIATYLDNNKKPMPDDCIVWMSVKR